jgi:hypothetical protein
MLINKKNMEKIEGQAVVVPSRERIFDMMSIFAAFHKPSTTLAQQALDPILN